MCGVWGGEGGDRCPSTLGQEPAGPAGSGCGGAGDSVLVDALPPLPDRNRHRGGHRPPPPMGMEGDGRLGGEGGQRVGVEVRGPVGGWVGEVGLFAARAGEGRVGAAAAGGWARESETRSRSEDGNDIKAKVHIPSMNFIAEMEGCGKFAHQCFGIIFCGFWANSKSLTEGELNFRIGLRARSSVYSP